MTVDARFAFTNRAVNLRSRDWQPHDDWGARYDAMGGYEDRDTQLEEQINSPFLGGSRWIETYVPTIGQGVTNNIAKTLTTVYWRYDGPMIDYHGRADITGAGTAGADVTLTIPVAANFSLGGCEFGMAMIFDQNTAIRYNCMVEEWTAVSVRFGVDQAGGIGGWGTNPNLALANLDQIRWAFRYRWT